MIFLYNFHLMFKKFKISKKKIKKEYEDIRKEILKKHFIYDIRMCRCGCVGVWVCGCGWGDVGMWVCGCVGLWVCGCVCMHM
jgi:hypothetical protein